MAGFSAQCGLHAVALLIASGIASAFSPGVGVLSRSVSSRSALSSCKSLPVSLVRSSRSGLHSLNMQDAKLGKKSTAKEVLDFYNVDLSGKTAIITGANSGIGLETSKALASVGCRVIMACRNVQAGRAAIATEIKEAGVGGYTVPDANIEVKELDLNDLRSVERFANDVLAQEERIDLLVNNAGIMALKNLEYTKQGFEKQIGVNHFGHFHLTSLLLPKLQAQEHECRVVTLSSVAHEGFGELELGNLHYASSRKYSSWGAYGQSKLANLLFTKGLHARVMSQPNNKISALAVHPGVIRTELWREQASWFNSILLPFMQDKTIPQGAATTVYACVANDLTGLRAGAYLSDCKVAVPSATARSQDNWEGLWSATQAQIDKVAVLAGEPVA